MNTDLTTTFNTALTLCVAVALKLNQFPIFYCTAIIIQTLLNRIAEIMGNTFNINDECLVNLLLFGSKKYTEIDNSHIVNATIKYLLNSGRFNGPLLWFTKQFDFDHTYGWLILDFRLFLFVCNPNAYYKLLGHSFGPVRFFLNVSFIFIVFIL